MEDHFNVRQKLVDYPMPEVGLETRCRIDPAQLIDSIARTVRTVIGFGGFSVQNRVQARGCEENIFEPHGHSAGVQI